MSTQPVPDLTFLLAPGYPLVGLECHARSVLSALPVEALGRVRVAQAATRRCDELTALVAACQLAERRGHQLDATRCTLDAYQGADGLNGWLVSGYYQPAQARTLEL